MEPKDRLRKANRVLAVQAALDRLAEWSLVDLDHRHSRLRDQRENLVRFLDRETALGDVLSAALLRRLQGLAEREAALEAEKDEAAARRRNERLRLRCAELVVERLGRETRRIDDLRELEQMIEAAQQRSRVRPEQA